METLLLRTTLYMLDLLAWRERDNARLMALSLKTTVDVLGRSHWGAIHSTLWNNAISDLNAMKQYSQNTELLDDIISQVYELREKQ